jgi:hypothetical protein
MKGEHVGGLMLGHRIHPPPLHLPSQKGEVGAVRRVLGHQIVNLYILLGVFQNHMHVIMLHGRIKNISI